jgi:hypothetical protein
MRRTPRRSMRWMLGSLVSAAALAITTAPSATAAWTAAPGTVLNNTNYTTGVHCVTMSTCLLVGQQSGVASSALAATWNGTSFTQQTPTSTTAELFGATCGPTICFAVGNDSGSGTSVPHAETWNGTSFGSSATATPSGATYSNLYRAACPSSSACFASGYYETATTDLPLMESWNGTSWSVQSLSLPANTTAAKLLGVACTSASSCWAAGYVEVSGQPRKTLILHWDGTSWTTQTSANPSGANGAQLGGIACTSASSCQAVGQYADGSSVLHSLAESWNGSTWTVQTVPDPGGGATDPQLFDVSCSGASACEAVGWTTVSGTTQPLAAGWNGTSWTLQSVPRPHDTSDAALVGVSCPSTCMTVGYSIYNGSTGISGLRPIVELGP